MRLHKTHMTCKNIQNKIMFFPEKGRLQILINYTQPKNTTPPLSPREDCIVRLSFFFR